jgi:hypothetical protein
VPADEEVVAASNDISSKSVDRDLGELGLEAIELVERDLGRLLGHDLLSHLRLRYNGGW